jgi:hypothetical protein
MELDPRWDWLEVYTWGDPQPRYIKGACNHLELEPVYNVAEQLVAQLCKTCGAELPAGVMLGEFD